MKLAVVTCGVFPSEAIARKKLWIFLKSCERFGIDPLIYGMGDAWTIYRDIKLNKQLAYLKTIVSQYSHYIYTDSWDAFFCAPLSEIVTKYEAMGSPSILCSACYQLGNVSRMDPYKGVFDETKRYRYPCVGGLVGEVPAAIEAFERMLRNPSPTSDDCFDYYIGYKEGWFKPKLDHQCEVFQVTEDHCVPDYLGDDVRLLNQHTGQHPCIYHLSGGYTDPATGKDHVMIPWAKQLRILNEEGQ